MHQIILFFERKVLLQFLENWISIAESVRLYQGSMNIFLDEKNRCFFSIDEWLSRYLILIFRTMGQTLKTGQGIPIFWMGKW